MKIWNDTQKDSFANLYRGISSNPQEAQEASKKMILADEIPMLFTEEGHVVCIPTKRREELKVGFFGTSRGGKSLTLNRFFNRMFWVGKRKSLWLNDVQNETFTMGRPMQNYAFKNKLDLIGEKPLHTPFIHLFPHTKDRISVRAKGYICAEFCFDFHKVLDRPDFFLELGGSQKYFNSLLDDFKKCRSPNEVEDVVKKIGDKRVREKIWSTIHFLFEEELFSFNNYGTKVYCKGTIHDKNTGERKDYSIIPACMLMMGCVSLHTKAITQKPYTKTYPELILREILDLHRNDPYFNRTPTHIAIDEIWYMSSRDLVNETIQEMAKLGTLPIGISYASQSYLTVDPFLRKNTRLSFVFGFKSKEEAKSIAENYGASNSIVTDMLRINRDKNECILLADEKLVVYDLVNNEKYYVTNEAIKGTSIPPPSNNQTPSSMTRTKPLIT